MLFRSVEREAVECFEDAVLGFRKVETDLGPTVEIATNFPCIFEKTIGLINDASWRSMAFGCRLGGS